VKNSTVEPSGLIFFLGATCSDQTLCQDLFSQANIDIHEECLENAAMKSECFD
jgi:hypothetical protein